MSANPEAKDKQSPAAGSPTTPASANEQSGRDDQGSVSAFAAGRVYEVDNEAEFERIAKWDDGGLLIIDFYATWCAPCKVIAPHFDKLAESPRFAAKARFARVDVDKANTLAARFGIRAMPTFLVLQGGKKVAEAVGANPQSLKAVVTQKYDAVVAGASAVAPESADRVA